MPPRKTLCFFLLLLTGLVVSCDRPATEMAANGSAATPPAATNAPVTTATTPAAFPDPPNEQRSLAVGAKGVQIYTCSPKKEDPTQFAWTLKAPEAELTDSKGYKVGKHYGGPTWEANDGSKVVGDRDKVQSVPAPNTIPWLMLPAKSTEGNGLFSKVKSIQRLNTEGGVAPATGCDKANAGKEVRVDYQATYYFYVAKP